MVRGEVFRLPAPSNARGNEQAGARWGVVVQSDAFLRLSTVLVAPTSTGARAATFRPVIDLDGTLTRVLVEQTRAIDPRRLRRSAGRLSPSELGEVEEALSLIFALDL